jgi:hypothetical protein
VIEQLTTVVPESFPDCVSLRKYVLKSISIPAPLLLSIASSEKWNATYSPVESESGVYSLPYSDVAGFVAVKEMPYSLEFTNTGNTMLTVFTMYNETPNNSIKGPPARHRTVSEVKGFHLGSHANPARQKIFPSDPAGANQMDRLGAGEAPYRDLPINYFSDCPLLNRNPLVGGVCSQFG